MEWKDWVYDGVFLTLVALLGVIGGNSYRRWRRQRKAHPRVARLIQDHFAPTTSDRLAIGERRFPFRVRADLQKAADRLLGQAAVVRRFCGIHREYGYE